MYKNGKPYQFPFPEEGLTELDQTYTHQKFLEYLENEVIDRALGCLFGSFIGDALGAYLQFAKPNEFESMLGNVMKMPGGGHFQLKPGQVTDDSELAFHLLKALADSFRPQEDFGQLTPKITLNIAKEYVSWGNSYPFDIGETCRKGIDEIRKTFVQNGVDQVESFLDFDKQNTVILSNEVHKNIRILSNSSQSNGSLMKIAPIHFFFGIINNDRNIGQGFLNKQMGVTRQIMKDFINEETSLLHSNQANIEICYKWSILVLSIIKRKSHDDLKHIYNASLSLFKEHSIYPTYINAKEKIGWVNIAVTLGLLSLKNIASKTQFQLKEELYQYQIKSVVERGGDTDTNAAIVGGMLGAVVGFKNLPSKYLLKLMDLRHSNKSHPGYRPQMYEPRVAFLRAFKIIDTYVNS